MKKLLVVVACVLSVAPAAQAQDERGDLRLMLETDFFRWIKTSIDDGLGGSEDFSSLALGPMGQGEGAMASLASGGVGYAVTDRVVVNGAFGITRWSSPDVDLSVLSMRVLPDVDILLTTGKVAPYVTLGFPISLSKLKDSEFDETIRAYGLGPQGGIGVMAGPFHAELTFAALFGNMKISGLDFGDAKENIRELTVGLSLGASLWM